MWIILNKLRLDWIIKQKKRGSRKGFISLTGGSGKARWKNNSLSWGYLQDRINAISALVIASKLIGLLYLASKFAVEMPNMRQGFLCDMSRSPGECGGWDCLLEKLASEIFNHPALSSAPFPFCSLTSVSYMQSEEAPTTGKGPRSEFCFRLGLKHTNALSECQLKRCAMWEWQVWVLFGAKRGLHPGR